MAELSLKQNDSFFVKKFPVFPALFKQFSYYFLIKAHSDNIYTCGYLHITIKTPEYTLMVNSIDEKHVKNLISSNLKRLRSLHNISQLILSQKTGLTHNFINDIENCKKGVSAKTLAKLSAVFNVEPYQFFLPEGSNNDLMIYVKDFNDSLQQVVAELTQKYSTEEKKGKS